MRWATDANSGETEKWEEHEQEMDGHLADKSEDWKGLVRDREYRCDVGDISAQDKEARGHENERVKVAHILRPL